MQIRQVVLDSNPSFKSSVVTKNIAKQNHRQNTIQNKNDFAALPSTQNYLRANICFRGHNEDLFPQFDHLTNPDMGLDEKVKKAVLAGADVNQQDELGDTPLHKWIQKEDSDTSLFLISKGADVNIRNKEGKMPLHYMRNLYESQFPVYSDLSVNYTKVLDAMLEKGAELNAKDAQGNTLLHLSCGDRTQELYPGYMHIYKHDFNIQNDKGETPAHILAKNNLHLLEYILKCKQDVNLNIQDNEGNTPFHNVFHKDNITSYTCYDYPKFIKYLISKGADLHKKNNKGETPFDLAIKNIDHKERLAIFKKVVRKFNL